MKPLRSVRKLNYFTQPLNTGHLGSPNVGWSNAGETYPAPENLFVDNVVLNSWTQYVKCSFTSNGIISWRQWNPASKIWLLCQLTIDSLRFKNSQAIQITCFHFLNAFSQPNLGTKEHALLGIPFLRGSKTPSQEQITNLHRGWKLRAMENCSSSDISGVSWKKSRHNRLDIMPHLVQIAACFLFIISKTWYVCLQLRSNPAKQEVPCRLCLPDVFDCVVTRS